MQLECPMKKILLSAAALIAATTCSASAADLSPRPAPAYVAPVSNWTGFHIGGFVGGAFGGNSGFSSNFNTVVGTRTDSAFFGGGQVGYNWQIAPNWVFGI